MKKSFLWSLIGLVAVAFASAYLAACHGNGGGGGSAPGGITTGAPTFSKGPITARGSILVNGVEFDTNSAAITVNGEPGSDADLKVGRFVTVRGSSADSTGTASNVDFLNVLTGPISALSGTVTSDMASKMTLTVFGQAIVVDSDTVLEPASLDLASLGTGSAIDVSGLTDPAGNIHATFIESRPTPTEFNIRGMVSNATGSTFMLMPGGTGGPLTVTLGAGATISGLDSAVAGTGGVLPVPCPASGTTDVTIADFFYAPADVTVSADTIVKWTNNGPASHTVTSTTVPANGDFDSGVMAAGTSVCFQFPSPGTYNYFCSIHPQMTGSVTVEAGGGDTTALLNGKSVNVTIDPAAFTDPAAASFTAKSVTVEAPLMPSENDIVFIEGFVTEATGTNGQAGMFMIDGLTANAGPLAVPSAGSHVMVRGRFSGGVLNADFIQFIGVLKFTIGPISSATTTTGAGNGDTSFVVNGTLFDAKTAQINVNARPGSTADLKAGKQVVVTSPVVSNLSTTVTGTDGMLNSGNTGTASSVLVLHNMQGPISALSGTISSTMTATTTITVFGQDILVNGNTRFDPPLASSGTGTEALATFATGSVILVSGERDGSGNILATHISSNPTGTEYHILGLVSGVTGSPVSSFTLAPAGNGTALTVDLAAGVTPTTGFAEGEFVDITIDPATVEAPFDATTVTATAVDVVDIPVPLAGDRVNVEGLVSGLSGSTFTVNSVEVDASGLTGGLPAGVMDGARVRVHGTAAADGTLMADRIVVMNGAQIM